MDSVGLRWRPVADDEASCLGVIFSRIALELFLGTVVGSVLFCILSCERLRPLASTRGHLREARALSSRSLQCPGFRSSHAASCCWRVLPMPYLPSLSCAGPLPRALAHLDGGARSPRPRPRSPTPSARGALHRVHKFMLLKFFDRRKGSERDRHWPRVGWGGVGWREKGAFERENESETQ